jgi:sugar-specific transcriptional regulator TrmB
MTSISKIFKALDLSPKAQKVFEVVVKKGPVPASAVASELGMPRATVYLEISNLRKLGLVSITGSNRRHRFIAEDPNRLVALVEEKTQKFSDLIPFAKDSAKDLESKIFSQWQKIPQISFFGGAEGVRKVLDSTVAAKSKEVLGILPALDLYNHLGRSYLSRLIKNRVRKGVRVRNIWPKGEVPEILSYHQEQLRDIRFFKFEKDFKTGFVTFDDYVIVITSLEELFSVKIKSKDLAQAMRMLFELLWGISGA